MAKKKADESEADASGSQSSVESGSQSEVGSGSQPAGSSDDTEASQAPAKKGASKKLSGKSAAVAAKKSGPAPRAAAPRPRGTGHELVPVICSECYEEFVFDSGVPSDTLTCPICEHQAARPDDAQLAVIAEKRRQEKTGFLVSLVLCLVSLAMFAVFLMLVRNPHNNANQNAGAFYGPSVVSLLAFLGSLGFSVGKYEGSRHDVYF